VPRRLILPLVIVAQVACAPEHRGPSLMAITDISPKRVGPADQLEILGSGFPESTAVEVIFEGDLHRPGQPDQQSARIVAHGRAKTSRLVVLDFAEELNRAFTGAAGEGIHTTFRGGVEVRFVSAKTGRQVSSGMLSDVVLDVAAPLPSPVLLRQRDVEATRALEFLGITLADPGTRGCCFVATSTGRAALAGVLPDDQLLSLDGVNVAEPTDLIPAGEAPVAKLGLRSGVDGPVTVRDLDVQGFQHAAPSELRRALGLVMGVLLWVMIALGPLQSPLSRLASAIAARLTVEIGGAPRTRFWRWQRLRRDHTVHASIAPEQGVLGLFRILTLVGLAWLAVALGLGGELVERELDIPLLALISTVAFVTSAAILGCRNEGARLKDSLAGALTALVLRVPWLGLLLMVGLEAGSFAVGELGAAHRRVASGWLLFHDPGLFGLGLLVFASLIPEIARPRRVLGGRASPQPVVELLERVRRGIEVIILALIGLGGSNLPELAFMPAPESLSSQILGGLVLLGKAVALYLILEGLRRVAERPNPDEVRPLMLKWGLLSTSLLMATSELWSRLTARFALGWLESVTEQLLAVTLLGTAGWVVVRVWILRGRPRNRSEPALWM